MNEQIQKDFLNQFPVLKHSLIMNQFCHAYRAGNVDIESLLAWVSQDAKNRLRDKRFLKPVDIVVQESLIRLIAAGEAVQMAEYVIWWESLDSQTKDAIRKERGEDFKNRYMESQPPTEKQIKYLRGLGCMEVPKSKLEASRLIDRLVNQ